MNEYQSHFFCNNIEYVPNEGHTTKQPEISCDSQRWFHSPDGGPSYTRLDGSSSKHTINNTNNLQLDFSNVSGSDEGIYGCLSNEGRRDSRICIQVYGESCPWPSLFLVTMCGYYCHIIIMFVVQVRQCLLRVHTS